MKTSKSKIKKRILTVIIALEMIFSSLITVYAAPSGVDSSSYNALVEIIFWVAGIAVAAAGAIPSIIKIVQGQADEDPRGRNAGIAGLVITGACVGALIAVKTLLF